MLALKAGLNTWFICKVLDLTLRADDIERKIEVGKSQEIGWHDPGAGWWHSLESLGEGMYEGRRDDEKERSMGR